VEKQIVTGSYWLGLLCSLIALGLRSLNIFGILTPTVLQQGRTHWYMSFYKGALLFFPDRHCHGELRLGAWREDLIGIPSHRHFGNRAHLAGRRQTVECRDIRISESEGMASSRCVRLECVKKKPEDCIYTCPFATLQAKGWCRCELKQNIHADRSTAISEPAFARGLRVLLCL